MRLCWLSYNNIFVFGLNSRETNIRLAVDATRLALEVLLVLSVSPKAQLALCEEIQLSSGEQQMGMRCDLLKSASLHLLCELLIILYCMRNKYFTNYSIGIPLLRSSSLAYVLFSYSWVDFDCCFFQQKKNRSKAKQS